MEILKIILNMKLQSYTFSHEGSKYTRRLLDILEKGIRHSTCNMVASTVLVEDMRLIPI